ncbi:MAG TPA: peptidoglycan-associated lipoprotein Pal [Geminicoccaceae bacterium]
MMRLFVSALALAALAACSSPDEMPPSQMDPGVAGGMGAPGDARTGAGSGAGVSTSDLPPGVEPGSQEDLELTVGDRVFFDYDSAVLNSQATGILDRQAAWLLGYPDLNVTIEGHTDERGTREYNLALGDRRANAVKNYLVALNVPASRILTISYGEERPAVAESSEDAYARNRRAVTVVNTVN